MTSEVGNISPESEGARAATDFLLDPTSLEKLQVLLSPTAWESFVAVATLSRDEADVLYEDLKQLRELMATEDRDMPSKEQLNKERFMEEFPHVKEELEKCIAKLRALADKVDEVHRDCTISNVVAASTGAVSGVMAIAGLLLAPVTAGASLALTAVGAGLGVASAVTSVSTGIVEYAENTSAEAEASDLVSDGINKSNLVMNVLGHSTSKIESLAKDCCQSLVVVLLNAHDLKTSKALPLLAAKVKGFMTTEVALAGKGQGVQRAVGGTALAMSKGARIFGAATSGLFLLMDVIDLVDQSKHLIEGAKAESAEQFRQQARELERGLEQLTQIHKNLQEGLNM